MGHIPAPPPPRPLGGWVAPKPAPPPLRDVRDVGAPGSLLTWLVLGGLLGLL